MKEGKGGGGGWKEGKTGREKGKERINQPSFVHFLQSVSPSDQFVASLRT